MVAALRDITRLREAADWRLRADLLRTVAVLPTPPDELPRHRVSVGCGWGSLRIHAARHHGVRAVGVTLSEQQAALARERVAAAGLTERIEVRLLNHGITTGGRHEVRDFGAEPDTFIGRYVFPDGALVPARTMIGHRERAGFEIQDVEQLRRHYARTLRHWVANLESDADEVRRLVGERTRRSGGPTSPARRWGSKPTTSG
jgi:cyclopropane fatty-acyl-phospholipid synthase-like methyltransferase